MRIDTPEEFVSLLEARLRAANLPQPIINGAVSQMRDQLVSDDLPGSLQARFRFPFQECGYVVQDDDVDLLDQSFQFSFSAAALGLGLLAGESLMASATILGIVQIGYTVYRTLHRLRRKAVKVTPAQYAIIGALKSIDAPATPGEIRSVLGARGDGIDVEAVLEELRTLRSRDGKSVGFVEQDRDARWLCVGI